MALQDNDEPCDSSSLIRMEKNIIMNQPSKEEEESFQIITETKQHFAKEAEERHLPEQALPIMIDSHSTNNNNNYNSTEMDHQTVTPTNQDEDDDNNNNNDHHNDNDLTPQHTQPRRLTRLEIWNLTLALLAWACTVSNVTIVVGTSAVVLLSLGGDPSLTSLPLGAFLVGSSLVSLWLTPWLFERWGRRHGFLVGIGIGLCGTVLGCLAVAKQSVACLTLASLLFGASMGVGFYLRFAAVELVSRPFQAKAVALVVSGGVVAAFAGPEAAQGTQNAIGDHVYLGTFVVTGVFGLCNALCLSLIQFPMTTTNKDSNQKAPVVNHANKEELNSDNVTEDKEDDESKDGNTKDKQDSQDNDDLRDEPSDKQYNADDEEQVRPSTTRPKQETAASSFVQTVLWQRSFVVPMLVSALVWSSMAMPMSVVRVVMQELGFSSRQSLTVIELHFLGMYLPGLVTGPCVATFGPWRVAAAGVSVFCIALAVNFLANSSAMAPWILGLFLVGVAWNVCFTAATVWTTQAAASSSIQDAALDKVDTSHDHHHKRQAANDFGTFFLAGIWIVSASYIYEAGGSGLEGWRVLNATVAGLVAVLGTLLVWDAAQQQQRKTQERTNRR